MKRRICRGPYHRGGELLPISEFDRRIYRSGRVGWQSWCRSCVHYKKHKKKQPNHGFVPFSRVWWIFEEMIGRLGHMEAARRTDIHPDTLGRMKKGIRSYVQKRTVAKAIAVLREIRRAGEFRHRDSISHGAYLRGRKERVVKREKDKHVL